MIAEKVQKLEQENIALKAQVEAMKDICGNKVEFPKNCEYCENFLQHYVKSGSVYLATYDGHCIAGNRIKKRKGGETCKYFKGMKYGQKNYI